jgi:DNA-binding PadR family transcriptional regulator
MAPAHAIFASLELQPMTRYDLKRFFDVLVGHFSTTMQSYIYKTLTDLEQGGWVEKNFIEQEGKPNRKEYSIIKTGLAELRRGMTAPPPDTRIKTAEYLGWSEAWNKYNSERTSAVLDELFGVAQVVDKHLAQHCAGCYSVTVLALSRPLGDDHA